MSSGAARRCLVELHVMSSGATGVSVFRIIIRY